MNGLSLSAVLSFFAFAAFGATYTLEVRNGGFERENAVISQAVSCDWAAGAATHTLAEVTSGQASPVPCGVDATGEEPVLFWKQSSMTAADAVRRFAWVPKTGADTSASDLRVTAAADFISIENGFFRLKHPVRGGGGFP